LLIKLFLVNWVWVVWLWLRRTLWKELQRAWAMHRQHQAGHQAGYQGSPRNPERRQSPMFH
jgi:hypothetical protein